MLQCSKYDIDGIVNIDFHAPVALMIPILPRVCIVGSDWSAEIQQNMTFARHSSSEPFSLKFSQKNLFHLLIS